MKHITVLQHEAVEALALASGSVVVDCTLGSGGHAREILKVLGTDGVYIGLDADPTAIKANQDLKTSGATVHLIHRNFRQFSSVLEELGIQQVNAVLADLGWRTEQFTEGKRGFSFSSDDSLLMTYGDPKDYLFTAHDIVNHWKEKDVANVIFGYGEERYSRRIAKAIIEARQNSDIETAKALADIVENAVPAHYRRGGIHPATKTFQALRIAVNDEFAALNELLTQGFEALQPGGRMAIITFHSLEDRIVKHYFRALADEGGATRITKKPLTPSLEEISQNPRARSAKLRVIERTHDSGSN